MNDAQSMCFLEDIANLRCNLDRAGSRETTLAGQGLRMCFAFDKLHNDEVASVGKVSGVEDHCCVRMAKFSHRSRFTKKAISNVLITSELASDDFYSNWAFKPEVGGKINGSHSADSDLTFDSESSGDKLGDIHNGPSFG